MIGRTNAGGGGKLKSANGTQAPDSANYMLTVTGLGFRPYAALAVSNTSPASTDGVRGFVCDADGNVIRTAGAANIATVSDDGFTIRMPSNKLMTYHWSAVGK